MKSKPNCFIQKILKFYQLLYDGTLKIRVYLPISVRNLIGDLKKSVVFHQFTPTIKTDHQYITDILLTVALNSGVHIIK